MRRRTFLGSAAMTALALFPTRSLLALEADNLYRENIGLQLYTLRKALSSDPRGALGQVAAAGYKQVELYDFPNVDGLAAAAKESGLEIHSSHFAWDCVVSPKDAGFSEFLTMLDKARALGLSHLVIPYLKDDQRGSLDAYKKVAENANKAAALARQAGIQLAYHNHNFEFLPREGGRSGFDILTEEFSKEMQFEVDVFWVKAAGLNPVSLIEKLKGRISQLHLKDLKEGVTIPNYGKLPEDAFRELGNGVIAMEPIIAAAREAGVKHCHVEQDQSPDALASVRQSMHYLRKL